MEQRITCSQCHQQLSVPWISQMIRCSFCQATITITRNSFASKAAISSGGAEYGRYRWKLEKICSVKRNGNSGTSSTNYKPPFMRTLSPLPWIQIRPKQRAVLCGVTYSSRPKLKVKGAVVDVKNMKELLQRRFQFPEEGIRVLTEEGKDDTLIPTRKNIQDALHWLVKDCKSGDSLVFFFSGHGLRQPDFDSDELDGFDETICPVDFMEQGMILHNDIKSIIVRPLTKGVILHSFVDCHHGTILDLPYVYNNIVDKWEDNRHLSGRDIGTRGGLAISFSSCADGRMAADTFAFEGKAMSGAMTCIFTKVINQNPNISYGKLLTTMDEAINNACQVYCLKYRILGGAFCKKISQETVLSSSELFDVYKTTFSF